MFAYGGARGRDTVTAMSLLLFAGARVGDFAAARDWYSRLLESEPAFEPHAAEAVWELAGGRYLFIEDEGEEPGGAVIAILVEDLDARVERISALGIDPADRVTYGNGARKAIYRDADGNEISFGEAPAEE
jgi:catechol 2,3-dioxygenase-like lactoylglutathione lyase family enzyme